MYEKLGQLLTEKNRAWLYRVIGSVATVLGFYGLASSEEIALWLGLAGSVLGNGLATAYTTTKEPEDPYADEEITSQDDLEEDELPQALNLEEDV